MRKLKKYINFIKKKIIKRCINFVKIYFSLLCFEKNNASHLSSSLFCLEQNWFLSTLSFPFLSLTLVVKL